MARLGARAILQRHHDALNRHDVAALTALYADDAVVVSPMFDTVTGKAAIGRSFERLFTIFPDYTVTMRDTLFIAEGDRAAEFGSVTATQRVEFLGLPPSGHPIEYHAARVFTLAHGLITYEQRIYDFGGVLERLEKTRLDRELTLASAVQQRLMGRRHSTGGAFDIAGSSLPCRTIGGDFVDYVDLPNGDVWVALGDVSGKGPAAALVAAMLQGMFSMTADADTSPAMLMERLNAALHRRGIGPSYATLFCGRLTATGWLEYANAGHGPPILLVDDEVRTLGSGGPILGIFDTATFPAERLHVGPGATIVAYSDGVTEAATPDGREFGLDGLVASVRAAGHTSLNALVESVIGNVRTFTGSDALTDDATVVAIRRRATL